MKLYCHPASTTSRPLMLFAAEQRIPVETQIVDLCIGEPYRPSFLAVNPNHQVPVLDDGEFRLTESCFASSFVALAETIGSDLSAYPNVRAFGRMKARPNRGAIHQVIDGCAASLDRRAMVPV